VRTGGVRIGRLRATVALLFLSGRGAVMALGLLTVKYYLTYVRRMLYVVIVALTQ
jgi:hypothetical protein